VRVLALALALFLLGCSQKLKRSQDLLPQGEPPERGGKDQGFKLSKVLKGGRVRRPLGLEP